MSDGLTTALPLTENVLVVEYGEVEYAPGVYDPPKIVWGSAGGLASSWLLNSTPSPELNNNTALVVVGKVVGGSSAINGMFFDRGSRFDYDTWNRLQGDQSGSRKKDVDWSWNGVYPFFKKGVTFTPPSDAVATKYNYTWDLSAFGNTTPIYASLPPFLWGDHYVSRESWKEMGIWVARECANGDKEGLCWIPISEHPVTARRSYAGIGHYAEVVDKRPNYHLLVKHQVARVVYPKGNTKSGPPLVEVRPQAGGPSFNISVKNEVVLSAGVFGTPAILQRSGIGPAAFLQSANIPLVLDLPGVGSNLHDHSGPRVEWNCKWQLELPCSS
jgi:choline dehydrogenase-like flavoprotein